MKLDFPLQRPLATVLLLPLKPFTGHRAMSDLETGLLQNKVKKLYGTHFLFSSEGWEKLGLYEYYRAKTTSQKAKEDDIMNGVREKSRSPSPLAREKSKSKSPPRRRYQRLHFDNKILNVASNCVFFPTVHRQITDSKCQTATKKVTKTTREEEVLRPPESNGLGPEIGRQGHLVHLEQGAGKEASRLRHSCS
jgi:hypothetical protein